MPALPFPSRTVYEDSGPGRPLSCLMEEPAPYTDGTGAAAGGGNCRFVESPSQDQRLLVQRLRNPEIRGSLQTPQNRPHGHQSPELPEGYGEYKVLPVAVVNTRTKSRFIRLISYSVSRGKSG